jgi:hypothetical protein
MTQMPIGTRDLDLNPAKHRWFYLCAVIVMMLRAERIRE